MTHLPHLISDLGLILGAAAFITLVCKKLKQPLVLGYLIAGMLVGPYVAIFPTVADKESIDIWAEIGVIFLLFALGLEFSFKKLASVGAPASVTAIVEAVCMIGLGYLTGQLLGWNKMDSIYLGAILSVSSTTIIIRAFDELGMKTQKFASLVFGTLIVEDLVAILLLVLLTTISVSQQFAGGELVMSMLKLGFFLALWFLAGIFLVPTFLKRIKTLITDEMLLIISLALCLLMVMLATRIGFSPALGAFIMGSILAETTKAEKIEHLIGPVKDLFGAVFFVSVGMMINPAMIVTYIWPITVITLVTVVGKLLSSGTGALLSGQSLKTSVQAGLSLSQIGEFSFIIATLGVSLKVTSDFLYPIAVAVSAITTFTTPYSIKYSASIYKWIEKLLPVKWRTALNRYSSSAQTITTESDWKVVLRTYTYVLVINSVIIIAVILLSSRFLSPFIQSFVSNVTWANILTAFIAFAIMAPFLWALGIRKIKSAAYASLWLDKKYNRGPLVALEMLRTGLIVFFVGFLLSQFFSATIAWLVAIPGVVVTLILFSLKLKSFYNRIERRFLRNLNARELETSEKTGYEELPWDLHAAFFTILPESEVAGKTLQELAFRETYNMNVAAIERGELRINAPGKYTRLYPGDEITVIGTDEQLEKFKKMLDNNIIYSPDGEEEDISLQQFTVKPPSSLIGKSIRESGIRERTKGLVVGIERNGHRTLNPESTEIFQSGDVVWIVGIKINPAKAPI